MIGGVVMVAAPRHSISLPLEQVWNVGHGPPQGPNGRTLGFGPSVLPRTKSLARRAFVPTFAAKAPGCSLVRPRQKSAKRIFYERAEKQQERLFWRLGG
jgi:hypothetical protein